MSAQSKTRRALWVGVGLSALIHAMTAWVGSALRVGDALALDRAPDLASSSLELAFAPEDLLPPEQPSPSDKQPDPSELAALPPEPKPKPVSPPPLEEQEIRLGIEKSKHDTKNWIGFADPTPNAAPKSVVEQAALDPKAGPAAVAPGSLGNSSPTQPSEMGEPVTPDSQPRELAKQTPDQLSQSEILNKPTLTQPPTRLAPDELKPEPESSPNTSPSDQPNPETAHPGDSNATKTVLPHPDVAVGPLVDGAAVERPFVGPRPAGDILSPNDPAAPEQSRAVRKATAPAAANVPPRSRPVPPPDAASLPSPAKPPQARPANPAAGQDVPALAGTTGQASEHAGEASDRESDPSSLEDAVIVLPGRPAAAEGLEIITRRPVFSRYVRTVAAPNDPVFKVTFGRDGQVMRATLVQSSGYKDVDDPVYNALLSWRAKGEKLSDLPSNDTQGLSITMRIVLR